MLLNSCTGYRICVCRFCISAVSVLNCLIVSPMPVTVPSTAVKMSNCALACGFGVRMMRAARGIQPSAILFVISEMLATVSLRFIQPLLLLLPALWYPVSSDSLPVLPRSPAHSLLAKFQVLRFREDIWRQGARSATAVLQPNTLLSTNIYGDPYLANMSS